MDGPFSNPTLIVGFVVLLVVSGSVAAVTAPTAQSAQIGGGAGENGTNPNGTNPNGTNPNGTNPNSTDQQSNATEERDISSQSNGPDLEPIDGSGPTGNGTAGTTESESTGDETNGETATRSPDITVRSASDLIQAAENAPEGANVYIPSDVTITLEPRQVVFEQSDITLYSDGGKFGEGGATIRMPNEVPRDQQIHAMIELRGDGSTVSGLRIIGPHPNLIAAETGSAYEFGNSFGLWMKGDDSTVYNAEVAGWSGAGVKFQEAQNGHVYLSNIHHNTDAGTGYGVSSERSWVLIQYNQFDANRHSIQSTRDTESGYRAEGNVQGPRRPNHAFDAHSASKTEPAHGGRRIEIVNNTFLPPSSETDAEGEPMDAPPIELDGRFGPVEGALIANNAFVGIDRDRSVIQNQENGESSDQFANAGDPSEFNNIDLRGNDFSDSRSAVPENIGAPDSLPAPGQIRGPDGTTDIGTGDTEGDGADQSEDGSFFSDPTQWAENTASDAALAALNSALNALGEQFANIVTPILLFAFETVVARGAPIGQLGGGAGAIFGDPDVPLYEQLYAINQALLGGIAITLFGVFLLFRIFGLALSPVRSRKSVGDAAAETTVDLFGLILSWTIPWAHFLIAAALSIWALPGRDTIASSSQESMAAIAGAIAIPAAGFLISFGILLVLGYLTFLHLAKFVEAMVGLAVYPLYIAFGIPDVRFLRRLSVRAEGLAEGYSEAAWYPFPTALTLGVGYAIATELSELFSGVFSGLGASFLALYYPALWITALYAPAWVFQQAVKRDLSTAALGSLALDDDDGDGGSGTSQSGQSGTSNPSPLPSGTYGSPMALGAVPGMGSNPPDFSPSPGASALDGADSPSTTADTPTVAGAAPATAATSSAASSSHLSSAPTVAGTANGRREVSEGIGQEDNESGSEGKSGGRGKTGQRWNTDTAAAGGATATSVGDGPIRPASRQEFDFEQGYEPVLEQSSGYQRIDPPKDASWAVDGGFKRVNEVYDESVYLRGENDGSLYDPTEITGQAVHDDGVFDMDSEDRRTVRNTR